MLMATQVETKEARALSQPFFAFWKLIAILCAVALAGVLLTHPRTVTRDIPDSPAAPSLSESEASPSDVAVAMKMSRAFSEVFRTVDPCVVSVIGESAFPSSASRKAPKIVEQGRRSQGSGIVIREDGIILTNNHVVEGSKSLTVVLSDGRRLRATLMGSDPYTDVAVLSASAHGLQVAKLGDSDKVEVGEWVLSVGNPFNLSHTLTVGVVGGKGRSNLDVAEYEDFIQTDAAINPGNSGGALVNLHGEVVGMNTAMGIQDGEYRGVGFAIPINMARRIAEDLISRGRVVRGYAGLSFQDMDEPLMRAFKVAVSAGVLVSDVERGGPADRAGIRPYDVISSFEGKGVANRAWLTNRIAAARPGQEVEAGVVRNGERFSARLVIGQAPDRATSKPPPSDVDSFGLDVEDLSPDVARSMGYEGEHGVLVTDVEPGSAAAEAGFQWGDLILEVNQRALRSQTDYKRILERVQEGDLIVFRMRRGEARVVLAAQMP